MKRFIVIAVMLLMAVGASAQEGRNIYNRYSGGKGVSAVSIKGRYELLMEVKEEGDALHIYTAGNEKIIESFVFIASDGDSVQFICIDGAMNRSDVEKLIVEASR